MADLIQQFESDEEAAAKRVDPLTVLPPEIVLKILNMFSFRERVGIMRTSQKWNLFIQSDLRLWAHVDIREAEYLRIPRSFVIKTIAIARANITTATLHNVRGPRDVLRKLCRLETLDRLELYAMPGFNKKFVRTVVAAENLRYLVLHQEGYSKTELLYQLLYEISGRLEYLDLVAVTPLDFSALDLRSMQELRLVLPNKEELSYEEATRTFGAAANLHTLNIESQSHHLFYEGVSLQCCTSLRNLNLDNCIEMLAELHLPDTVERLSLTMVSTLSCDFLDNSPNPMHRYLSPSLKDLELHCSYIHFDDLWYVLTANSIGKHDRQSATPQSPNIQLNRLVLDWFIPAGEATDPRPQHNLAAVDFSCLRELEMYGCEYLYASDVELLVSRMPVLETLICWYAVDFWDIEIKKIVMAGTMRELVFKDCMAVSDELVYWAKDRSVRVVVENYLS